MKCVKTKQLLKTQRYTPQPLYNTIVGVQANFRVSYPNLVISRVKCIGYIGKGVLDSHLGSSSHPCYIQNRVISNRVIKRFRCTTLTWYHKISNFSDTRNICCNHPKIWSRWHYHRVMHPKDADGMANTVCPDMSVRKLRTITAYFNMVTRTQIFSFIVKQKGESKRVSFLYSAVHLHK